MFRIYHLQKLTNISVNLLQRSPNKTAKYFALQNIYCNNHLVRWYSSKDKDDVNKKVQDLKKKACEDKQAKKEKPKIVLRDCKPVTIPPCAPPTPQSLVNAEKQLPHINEDDCPPKSTLEDECPQAKEEDPECPHDETSKWANYKNAALLGLLIAAATLGTLYYLGYFGKPKVEDADMKKKKKKKTKRIVTKDPLNLGEIPDDVPYLLIGGGTASFAAFRAIKSAEPTAKVLVISNESFFPYMRPPLSKEMWYNEDEESIKKLIFKQWNGSERNLFYEPDDFYIKCMQLMANPNGGVAVARGYSVSHLDVVNRIAYVEGREIHYDKCLIATGAIPKTLNVFEAACNTDPNVDERVKIFRNIFDFEDVYEAFNESKAVAIVGGGFLGSELACALARKGKKKKSIVQIFREPGNMGKILPEYLSNWTTNKIKQEGVKVYSCSEVIGVKYEEGKLLLILNGNRSVAVDHVILAVGAEANTEMAQKSNLEVDPELGGFLVNTELLARSNLYIAGDCACFYDVKLGRRRVEHHDHAVVTGRLAGENMVGGTNPYLHQSMFWSDLGPDVGYEAIGIVDSSLPTVGVFAKASAKDTPKAVVTETGEGIRSTTEEQAQSECVKPGEIDHFEEIKDKEDYGKGIVFYMRDDVVVGIVLWNVFNRMSIARQVLKDERKYDDLNEVAKLFNIHEE